MSTLTQRLHRAARAAEHLAANRLRTISMSHRRLAVLECVEAHPGLSQTDIGISTGIDRSTTSQMLRTMAKYELVTLKRTTARDARIVHVYLTAIGHSALAASRAIVLNADERIAEAVDSIDEFELELDAIIALEPSHVIDIQSRGERRQQAAE